MHLDDLKKKVSYNPVIGQFHWLISSGRASAGSEAGWVNAAGYRYIKVKAQELRGEFARG